MQALASTRVRWILLAASATTYVSLAVYFSLQPFPTRIDAVADALLRPGDAKDPWGDESSELLVDYTLMGLFWAALVVAAWRFGRAESGLLVAGTIAVQEVVIRATKSWVARPRPDGAYSVTGAFPSGHVANLSLSILLFLLVVLPLLRGRGHFRGRLPGEAGYAGALIATFALYRVFAGEHWLTDVVGGVALALAFGLGAERLARAQVTGRR
jgi:membrane-associated phospholipid phosphatase